MANLTALVDSTNVCGTTGRVEKGNPILQLLFDLRDNSREK
jgi:hypothetical protein